MRLLGLQHHECRPRRHDGQNLPHVKLRLGRGAEMTVWFYWDPSPAELYRQIERLTRRAGEQLTEDEEREVVMLTGVFAGVPVAGAAMVQPDGWSMHPDYQKEGD